MSSSSTWTRINCLLSALWGKNLITRKCILRCQCRTRSCPSSSSPPGSPLAPDHLKFIYLRLCTSCVRDIVSHLDAGRHELLRVRRHPRRRRRDRGGGVGGEPGAGVEGALLDLHGNNDADVLLLLGRVRLLRLRLRLRRVVGCRGCRSWVSWLLRRVGLLLRRVGLLLRLWWVRLRLLGRICLRRPRRVPMLLRRVRSRRGRRVRPLLRRVRRGNCRQRQQ